MDMHHHAKEIVAAVALLNKMGRGRLRLQCYVKEGLGAWRHGLFASDRFSFSTNDATPLFSLPGRPIGAGETAASIAESIEKEFPALMAMSAGSPSQYGRWLETLQISDGRFVFEMEDEFRATLNSKAFKPDF